MEENVFSAEAWARQLDMAALEPVPDNGTDLANSLEEPFADLDIVSLFDPFAVWLAGRRFRSRGRTSSA